MEEQYLPVTSVRYASSYTWRRYAEKRVLITHINSPVMCVVPVDSVPQVLEEIPVSRIRERLTDVMLEIRGGVRIGYYLTYCDRRVAALVGLNFEGKADDDN
jgi:hypothetical protein